MVAYSFKKRFAEPLVDGRKVGTIREARGGHGHAAPGKALQLYTGMRTKHCQLVRADLVCTAVLPISFDFAIPAVIITAAGLLRPVLDLERFAIADGFRSWAEMCAFWNPPEGETFEMFWILWVPPHELVRRGILGA
jgi:hypothetical protein